MKVAITDFSLSLLSTFSIANIYYFIIIRKVTLKRVSSKFIDIFIFTSVRRHFLFSRIKA